MAPPGKKSKASRISQVRNEIYSPKHGKSLVETGYATSMVDLNAKSRNRARKPSSKGLFCRKSDDEIEISNPVLLHSTVSNGKCIIEGQTLRQSNGEIIGGIQAVELSKKDHDEDGISEYESEMSPVLAVVLKIFTVVVLSLSMNTLAVGIALSISMLLFVELVGRQLDKYPNAYKRLKSLIGSIFFRLPAYWSKEVILEEDKATVNASIGIKKKPSSSEEMYEAEDHVKKADSFEEAQTWAPAWELKYNDTTERLPNECLEMENKLVIEEDGAEVSPGKEKHQKKLGKRMMLSKGNHAGEKGSLRYLPSPQESSEKCMEPEKNLVIEDGAEVSTDKKKHKQKLVKGMKLPNGDLAKKNRSLNYLLSPQESSKESIESENNVVTEEDGALVSMDSKKHKRKSKFIKKILQKGHHSEKSRTRSQELLKELPELENQVVVEEKDGGEVSRDKKHKNRSKFVKKILSKGDHSEKNRSQKLYLEDSQELRTGSLESENKEIIEKEDNGAEVLTLGIKQKKKIKSIKKIFLQKLRKKNKDNKRIVVTNFDDESSSNRCECREKENYWESEGYIDCNGEVSPSLLQQKRHKEEKEQKNTVGRQFCSSEPCMCNPDITKTHHELGEGREINFENLTLFPVALAGLLGGQIVAFVITIIWCVLLKLVGQLKT